MELLKSPDLQDYDVGAGGLRHPGLWRSDPIPLSRGRSVLEERIASLAPTGTENSFLDIGLQLAWDMLNAAAGKGELIVLSDGNLWNYEDVIRHFCPTTSRDEHYNSPHPGAGLSWKDGQAGRSGSQTGAEYASFVYPQSLTTQVQGLPEQKPAEEKPAAGYCYTLWPTRTITSPLIWS